MTLALAIGTAAAASLAALGLGLNAIGMRAARKAAAGYRRRPAKYQAVKTDWDRVLEETDLERRK